MTGTPNLENTDTQLAEFADRILAGEDIVAYEQTASGTELQTLQATVARAQRAFGDATPPADMAQRIRANLEIEWRQAASRQSSVFAEAFNRLSGNGWQSRRQRQTRRLGVALASLVVVAAVGVFVFGSGSNANGGKFPGTAVGDFAVAILLPALLALGGLLWWDSRRKS